MIYDVRHTTTFEYEQDVSEAQHVLRLMPRDWERQHRVAFALNFEPQPSRESVSEDYFGNMVHYVTLNEPHTRFVIDARSRVEVLPPPGDPAAIPVSSWEEMVTQLKAGGVDALEAQEFTYDSPFVFTSDELRNFARASFPPGRPLIEAALALTARIFSEFEYQGGVSDVTTPISTVLEQRSGVCQDFAHLEIGCFRSLGLAARYVSGYLLTHPPEGQEKLVGADASHAWVSLYAGPLGWIDLDPTNDLIPGEEHIVIGWGRDYGDVSPTSGFIVGGGAHEVSVAVDVSPANQ